MKNLPHQINQLPRLNRALRVFVDLAAAGDDLEDQGVVGDALARSGAYTFRTPGDTPLEELLAAEHLKPIGSQGTRTAVRDLRRFFGLLGFVLRSEADGWLITDSARKLVDLQARSDLPRIRELWREALLDLALEDAGGTSHPYRILLRLVGEMPDLPKAYSGLCLEAVDDSAGEFARILQIARRANPPATMEAIAGRHNARNSTKILPPLAIQLGDLIDANGRLVVAGAIANALRDPGRARRRDAVIRNLVRRPFAPRPRTGAGSRRSTASGITVRRYDPDLIGTRYNDHEDCLDRFSNLFSEDIKRFEAIYDLLLVTVGTVLLVEAKTIRNDDRIQVRTAVGQLYYYDYFEVRPLYPAHNTKRLLVTDGPLANDISEFLTTLDIGVIWIERDGSRGGSDLGLAHLEQFGVGE